MQTGHDSLSDPLAVLDLNSMDHLLRPLRPSVSRLVGRNLGTRGTKAGSPQPPLPPVQPVVEEDIEQWTLLVRIASASATDGDRLRK